MTETHTKTESTIDDDLRSTGDARKVVGTAPDIPTKVQPSLGDPENAPGLRGKEKIVPPPEAQAEEPAKEIEDAVFDLDRPV
ncbi:MAG TPA: hypothetical protein VLA00_09400 [Xanthobacteraceae bacterium]|nr:hypothetical protein [Xanthobacteraceae bacterium]